jgi:hypothetical protein
MRALQGKRALPIGIVALGLVAAACGNNASASEKGWATAAPTPAPTPSPSYGMLPSNTKTVVEGRGNSFAFVPASITVRARP